MSDWGYSCGNGPVTWAKTYPISSTGKRQSPIDFNTKTCVNVSCDDPQWKPLVYSYPDKMTGLELTNTGFGWMVNIPNEYSVQTNLQGGPLGHAYKLVQFHCHWGKDCSVGSEHTVDKQKYAAELHFVHFNSEKYNSFKDAFKEEKGLAVIGVMVTVGQTPNDELNKLTKLMNLISYKKQSIQIVDDVVVQNYYPKDKAFYYSYEGSLTTPPLCETVTWIVYPTPISATEQQINEFRQLCSHSSADIPLSGPNRLLANYREPQPINERIVKCIPAHK